MTSSPGIYYLLGELMFTGKALRISRRRQFHYYYLLIVSTILTVLLFVLHRERRRYGSWQLRSR